jgi:hypothetical protein
VIPMAQLPSRSGASRTRRQGELPELAEISSSGVVLWEGPQLDPERNGGGARSCSIVNH